MSLSKWNIEGGINRITGDVMVTSDDLIPSVGMQTQLRDTSRFPYMFTLLATLIDRIRTIARASPAPLLFSTVQLATHFHSRQFRRLFLMFSHSTWNETRMKFLFVWLSTFIFFFLSCLYYLILCIILFFININLFLLSILFVVTLTNWL